MGQTKSVQLLNVKGDAVVLVVSELLTLLRKNTFLLEQLNLNGHTTTLDKSTLERFCSHIRWDCTGRITFVSGMYKACW